MFLNHLLKSLRQYLLPPRVDEGPCSLLFSLLFQMPIPFQVQHVIHILDGKFHILMEAPDFLQGKKKNEKANDSVFQEPGGRCTKTIKIILQGFSTKNQKEQRKYSRL